MSSAGTCIRALSAERIGLKPAKEPEFLATAAEEGKWHEQRIQEELTKEYTVTTGNNCNKCHPNPDGSPRSGIHVEIDTPNFALVGHMDGILKDKQGFHRILEVKSMSQGEFNRWKKGGIEVFPSYKGQLACYFMSTGFLEALYAVKNRNSGTLEKPILKAEDFVSTYYKILQNLNTVEELAKTKELAIAEFDPDSIECQRCSFQHLCIPTPEINKVDERALELATEQWRKGKALEAESKELIDSAKTIINAYAMAQPTHKLFINGISASIVKFTKETYPKANLLKIIDEEMLRTVAETSVVEYCKISDTRQA